jgi:MFS family permease
VSSAFRHRLDSASAVYAFSATMLGTTLTTPLYSLYQRRFGFSELIITLIFATYAAGVIAALLVFGGLSDEVGRRPVLLVGLGFSALSAVAFLVANGLPVLLVGRLLSGLSAGIFTGTATATIVDLAPERARGRATLLATVANMVGLGCGPLLAGLIAEWVSHPLRSAYWADLGLLVPAVAGVLLMREPVSKQGRPRLRLQAMSVPADMRAVFLRSSLIGFAGFAVLGLCTAVAPAFLGRELAVSSAAIIGLVVFGVFLASAFGQALLERVPHRVAIAAACAGLILGMGLLALSLAVTSLALLVIGITLAGAAQGLGFRAALADVNQAAPAAQRAEVDSSFFVVAYLAISVPVIGEGMLAQTASLRTAGLVFAAVVAAIAAGVLTLLSRSKSG